MNEQKKLKLEEFHDKHYKTLLLIPGIILLLSLVYIGIFYSQNGDIINKDISLTGGTTVTLTENIDPQQIEIDLSSQLADLNVREIYDVISNERKAVIIETTSDQVLTRQVLEDYLGYDLSEQNSSFEFTGSALSESFYKQLLFAIALSFVFMAIVIFLLFRSPIPSAAVVLAALADMIMTLAVVNFLGMKISSAGIIAFLMLIGYSVDTDILLTNRVLKRTEGTINHKVYDSFKTGMTMTLTAFAVVFLSFLIVNSASAVLGQIFAVLSIGLFFDMINTWITNVSILKWYLLKK